MAIGRLEDAMSLIDAAAWEILLIKIRPPPKGTRDPRGGPCSLIACVVCPVLVCWFSWLPLPGVTGAPSSQGCFGHSPWHWGPFIFFFFPSEDFFILIWPADMVHSLTV